MRTLWRTEPSIDLEPISDWIGEINRVFRTPSLLWPFTERAQFASAPLDVYENDRFFKIKASLPGVKPENLNIEIQNDILTISGELKEEKEEENANYYRREISHGAFRRAVRLPENLQLDKIEANFQDGIATITIPKIEAKAPKTIKVPVNTQR